jgi:branched-chain amino acid transport system permease protein
MSAELFLQFLTNAVVMGALYGLMGLSFGIIYSTTKILHFAHGSVYVGAAYLFYVFYGIFNLALVPSAGLTLALTGLLGVATMRYLYGPLIKRGASGLVILIASLGLYIVSENAVVIVFSNETRVLSKAAVSQGLQLGMVVVTPLQVAIVAIAIVIFLLTFALMRYSRLGRALRGMADDVGMAEIVGMEVPRLRYAIFGLGSVILGVAAILNGLDVGIHPGMGLMVVLIAAVAAIIGGASGILTGIAGGVVIAFLQNFGILWIDPRWQNLITFSALVLVLAVRPAGLFGRQNA